MYLITRTRNVPVVVVVASPLKCHHCSALLLEGSSESWIQKQICSACGWPQPESAVDYFDFFELPRRFRQDRPLLEKRFFRLCRALHPDRFTGADVGAKENSLKKMSFLNEAYRTLISPSLLRHYILELEGAAPPSGSSKNSSTNAMANVPMELVEEWFEIQELISESAFESQVEIQRRLGLFENELSAFRDKIEVRLISLETEYDDQSDRALAREILIKLNSEIQTLNYLNSMSKDVERIKKNAYSN